MADNADLQPPRRNWAHSSEELVAAFRLPGGVHFALLCPFCGDIHLHGAAVAGSRGSHCLSGSKSYYLVDAGPAASTGAVARKFGKRRP